LCTSYVHYNQSPHRSPLWCTSAVSQSTPAPRVINETANTQRTAGSSTDGISSCSSLINNSETRSTCTADNVINGANVVQSRTIGTDWASAPALPTYNPYEVLADAAQLHSDDDIVRGAEQPFITYESKQARRKRERQESRQQQRQTAAAGQQTAGIRNDQCCQK